MTTPASLSFEAYDEQWSRLGDFIRYNPGARHRRRISLDLIRDINPKETLDVGCGLGEFILSLKARFPNIQRVVGADFAQQTIASNQTSMPFATFHVLDISKQALSDRFDLVSCLEVIEHLDDQISAMRNLAQMVAAGGYLLLSCPLGRIYPTERGFGHVRHPTTDDWKTWAREVDMDIVEIRTWGWPTYSLVKMLANIDPEMAVKKFGSGRPYTAMDKLINNSLYALSFLSLPSKNAVQSFCLMRKRD